MRKPFILILCLVCSVAAISQNNQKCVFERLFVIKPGADKPSVLDSLNKLNLTLVSNLTEKLPPYANQGGDSIIAETYVYTANEPTECFQGNNSKMAVSFADNKLFKVYISTEYSKSAMADMMTNYNNLRNVIKPKWKHEKGVKLNSDNIVGFGYRYTKTQKFTNKTENILLQYVDNNTKSMSGKYTLEVVWANLNNTRMETSSY